MALTDLSASGGGRTSRLAFEKAFPPIGRAQLAYFRGASGDLNPIHLDSDFARASGFDDVFAQGMLVMAYLADALDEAGLTPGLAQFSSRFVAITPLGATIVCRGWVEEIGPTHVALTLAASDQDGDIKLTGKARVHRDFWETTLGQV